jgi:CubicO group peptidase (beta-lactamase class C family)
MRCLKATSTLVALSGLLAAQCGLSWPSSIQAGRWSYGDPEPDQFLTRWLVCGPFPVTETQQAGVEEGLRKQAFDLDYLSEHGGETGVQPLPGLAHRYAGREYSWRVISIREDVVDLSRIFGQKEQVVAYAWVEIEMSAPASAQLGLGSDDAVKVWLNGELVHRNMHGRAVGIDDEVVSVRLHAGKNRLLLKVQNDDGPWGSCCRLLGPAGKGRTLLRSASNRSSSDASPVSELLARLEEDLSLGSAAVAKNWPWNEVQEYSLDLIDLPLAAGLRYRLGRAADGLTGLAPQMPAGARGPVRYLAARFYWAAGATKKAMASGQAVRGNPDLEAQVRFLLEEMRYRTSRRHGPPPVDLFLEAERRRRQIPGLSFAVVVGDRVVHLKGYGQANVELSVPATEQTVFSLGSVTKQFTATAVMMLVEEGKLRLDDRLTSLLPGLPAAWEKITIRHLLTHTAGLGNYIDALPRLQSQGGPTPEAILRLSFERPLRFPPGEQWSYSNTGYFLLTLVIEKVGGCSYNEFLTRRVFQPLQMTSTQVGERIPITKNRAAGYTRVGNSLENCDPFNLAWAYGAGGLESTAADMAKWVAALSGERLLKRSSLEQMWAPARLNDGKPVVYGFGWG